MRITTGAFLVIVASVLAGCGSQREPERSKRPPSTNGHERMLAQLERIRERTADEHPFLGTRPLRAAERALNAAKNSVSVPPGELSRLHGMLGEELLRAGRTEEAAAQIRAALDVLPRGRRMGDIEEHARYRLAVACLRLGENANCVHCANGASCLFPISPEGVHTNPAGSRAAVEHLLDVLENSPENLSARWLLNIAHMTLGTWPDEVPDEFRIPPSVLATDAAGIRPFRNVAMSLGLDTRNPAGGVIVDDFDGDEYLDVMTSSWDTAQPLRLFRNNRDGTFSDVSRAAGLQGLYGGLNLLQADTDNDGDLDVLVLRGAWLQENGRHPNSLLQNDGAGRFRDVTFESGLGDVHYPTQTAGWADYDNDGDLDLYVGNELHPSQLFENDGQGAFRDVAPRAGVQNLRPAKAVAWGDFDEDGWPDLYVSNLPGANRLYRNRRDGTFTDVAADLGVERPLYSFPAWFWDFDNDGRLDLYVSSYEPGIQFVAADYLGGEVQGERDRLYRGTPGGAFEEVSASVGPHRVTQPMGSNFGDINNDGWLDFYLGTGYVDYEGLMPNLLFVNRFGKRFEDVTYAARVGHLQKGHAVALADLDHDGDQDIFAQMGGWFAGDAFANALFENPGTDNHWLGVRLVGRRSNRSAIGARIRAEFVDGESRREVYRWVNSGGSFGANPLRQHLGVGRAERIDVLEVHWPTTKQSQVFRDLPADLCIEIVESQAEYRTLSLNRVQFHEAGLVDHPE